MLIATLHHAARALGGESVGGQVLCPGPGHSPHDRSLAVRFDHRAPGGFVVTSFAGDDWGECRDHVRARLGLDRREIRLETKTERHPRSAPARSDRIALAQSIWQRRYPIAGSPAEIYLREARGYRGPLPETLGYLPALGEHLHSMIAAYGLADELEPGTLAIADDAVRAVHITRLALYGLGKAGTDADKITIASPGGSPIVLAPANDLLGLAITEGIEDALSAHAATGLGAWAAGSAPFLPSLADAVPPYIECVTIFAHNDQSGHHGATELAAMLVARGIEVLIEGLS